MDTIEKVPGGGTVKQITKSINDLTITYNPGEAVAPATPGKPKKQHNASGSTKHVRKDKYVYRITEINPEWPIIEKHGKPRSRIMESEKKLEGTKDTTAAFNKGFGTKYTAEDLKVELMAKVSS